MAPSPPLLAARPSLQQPTGRVADGAGAWGWGWCLHSSGAAWACRDVRTLAQSRLRVELYVQTFLYQKYFWTRPFETTRIILKMFFSH